ncbi:MAG TPA: hypothetical protein VF505_18535, partial [Thermoanaerobaculia bacterium]
LAVGVLCFLFVALMSFGFFVASSRTPALPFRQMIVSALMYLAGGFLLTTLGIGSMMARRWARDLSLLVAWFWLLIGGGTTLTMIFMVPRLMPKMPGQDGVSTFVMTCMMVFAGLFGVVVPAGMILFYRSPHVRATCLALDPHPRWTERVPLPLLGLSLWQLFGAVSIMSMSGYAVLPLGRQIVTGPLAILVFCTIGALLLYVSWGLYLRRLAAWWAGIAYGVLIAIYCVVVFPRINYEQMIEAMGMPKTPNMPDLDAIYRSPWFFAFLACFWLLYFGYFLFVLRYFPRERPVFPGAEPAGSPGGS